MSGNTLFGTSSGGGSNGSGTVFKLNTDGSGFTNVYTFSALDPSAVTNADGSNPSAGLILAGNILYSTPEAGGNYNSGTVFAVKTNGTSFTTLYAFTGGSDGGNPLAGLILSGNALYGTTFSDGNYGYGNVFLIDTNGANFTDIYDFTGGNDGGPVDAGLLLAGNTVYGVTEAGGSVGDGTVFGLALPDVNTTQLAILNLSLSGTNLVINGANGVSGGSYALFTTTNLALPLAQWSPVVTNVLSASGNFTITATNAVKRKLPKQFYILEKQ